MPAFPKYHIPEAELFDVHQRKCGFSDLARKYGCSPSTVKDQIKKMLSEPKDKTDSQIDPGHGGDEMFASLMAGRVFDDVRTASLRFAVHLQRRIDQPYSLTGCGAALACV